MNARKNGKYICSREVSIFVGPPVYGLGRYKPQKKYYNRREIQLVVLSLSEPENEFKVNVYKIFGAHHYIIQYDL